MPVEDAHAELGGHLEHARVVHPLHERIMGLGGQIDQDAPVRLLAGGLDDGVERFVALSITTGEA